MLGGNVLVFELVRLFLGGAEHFFQLAIDGQLPAGHFGQPFEFAVGDLLKARQVGADLFEDRLDDAALGLVYHGRQQVHGRHHRVLIGRSTLLRCRNGLLCFDGQFVESHGSPVVSSKA